MRTEDICVRVSTRCTIIHDSGRGEERWKSHQRREIDVKEM
jgi:hypothetical protein